MARKGKEPAKPANVNEWETVKDPTDEAEGPPPPEMLNLRTEGASFEGIFVSSRVIVQRGKRDSRGQPRKSSIHKFSKDGKPCECWGTAMLDRLLAQVKRGSPVRIVYKGTVKVEGANNKHVFEVLSRAPTDATIAEAKAIEPF